MLARFLCGAALLLVAADCAAVSTRSKVKSMSRRTRISSTAANGHGPDYKGAIDAFEKALE